MLRYHLMQKYHTVFIFFYMVPVLWLFSGVIRAPLAAQPNIVGETTAEEIKQEFRIFDLYTKRYTPDAAVIKQINAVRGDIEIVTILGTWCKDSKKHIPSLFKVLESAQNQNIRTRYVGVDYFNNDPDGNYQKYGLTATPTIIVFKNGAEAGRITEKPEINIETDLLKLLLENGRDEKK